MPKAKSDQPSGRPSAPAALKLPGQVVLVFQGGGALGAYQCGVYEALHEAGIEPDWIVGTSIGAINGAIIAGNEPEDRVARLRAFWERVQTPGSFWPCSFWEGADLALSKTMILANGVPGFFAPNARAAEGPYAAVGVEQASAYSVAPLRETLTELVDGALLNARRVRLTLGAVSVRDGATRYFDSRDQTLSLDHVLASCALPPAFPAVRIDGEPFWDGGIYSNTPIDAVFDDSSRTDSVIFAVNLWHPHGPEPDSLWQVLSRQKEISFASRIDSHMVQQRQAQRLRHTIHELVSLLPEAERRRPEIQELARSGCPAQLHIIRLLPRRLENEDATRDIDFTAAGIRARWDNGYADVCAVIRDAPWAQDLDLSGGAIIHDFGHE